MPSDDKSPEVSLLILYSAEVMCRIKNYCGFFDKVKSRTTSAQVDAILMASIVCEEKVQDTCLKRTSIRQMTVQLFSPTRLLAVCTTYTLVTLHLPAN